MFVRCVSFIFMLRDSTSTQPFFSSYITVSSCYSFASGLAFLASGPLLQKSVKIFQTNYDQSYLCYGFVNYSYKYVRFTFLMGAPNHSLTQIVSKFHLQRCLNGKRDFLVTEH